MVPNLHAREPSRVGGCRPPRLPYEGFVQLLLQSPDVVLIRRV